MLVADDDADIRELVVFKLSTSGYDVDQAADGLEALEKARRTRPDVLLADVNMPRLDGLGLLAQVRASDDLRDLPVLLLTAKAQPADVAAGLDAGASAYVTKPFSPARLVEEVARLLVREPDRIA